MAEQSGDDDYETQEVDRSHLEGLEDGCGCTEVWEHLSAEDADDERSTE